MSLNIAELHTVWDLEKIKEKTDHLQTWLNEETHNLDVNMRWESIMQSDVICYGAS